MKETRDFGPMWQTKYASAVPIDLGLEFDFRPFFGRAVKAISPPGVRSPWVLVSTS